MADSWVVVGVGSGQPDQITPEACQAIQKAEILIGNPRLLQQLLSPDQDGYEFSGDLNCLRLNLTAWENRSIALLVSGDPGFYSILEWLRREFPGQALSVIPGISSMQIAFARLAQSWYDCKFLSLHGRPMPDLVIEIAACSKLCLLTDKHNHPARIVGTLIAGGIRRKWVFIGSNLGTELEQIWQGWLEDYSSKDLDDSFSVVIIEDEHLAPSNPGDTR